MKYVFTVMTLALIASVTSIVVNHSSIVVPEAGAATLFADLQYSLAVHDERSGERGNQGLISSGVYVFVYDAGTKTLSTLYSDKRRTAKTNPISRAQFATDGLVTFYGPNTSYDIVLAHSDGSLAKHASVTSTMHRLPLPRQGSDKLMVFPMLFNAGGTEVDTGLDLPYGSLVTDAWVEVVTVDATETVDVGLLSSETAGDADGFLAAVSVATAGVPARVTYTVGSNETYLSAFTYGALLGVKSLGNDVATDVGSAFRLTHYVTGANATSISYTPSTSDTFAGYGYVKFNVLR